MSRSRSARAGSSSPEGERELPRPRLARWVKSESLGRLRRDRPDVALAGTTNAEDNGAIRAVTAHLGFVAAAVHTFCRLDV